MHLDDLLGTVEHSTAEDWRIIVAVGGGWPSYLDYISWWATPGQTGIEVESHTNRAVYISDVSMGLAWGLSNSDDTRSFDWANFPDPTIYTTILDVLWNGSLVHREQGLVVDGARARLPFPRLAVSDDDQAQQWFEQRSVALYRLAWQLEGAAGASFDDYLAQTGLPIR